MTIGNKGNHAKNMKLLTSVLVGLLLLSGCSSQANSEPEIKYDEVELIVFRTCVENYVSGSTNSRFGSYLNVKYATEEAIVECRKFLPTKK